MKNSETDPRIKTDQSNEDNISDTPHTDSSKSESESDRRHRARNYMNGEDDIEGPDFNEGSEGADGDTTSNAGVFK